jgi:glyoxylase-like metal-dependent hydrolase (beta-lactamase superfamily II)
MVLHRSAEITDGVHFYLWVGQSMNCNSVVLANALAGAQPHVLVDPGMTGGAMGERPLESLAEAMSADGLRMEDVGLVVGTHCHPDHYQAVDEVVRRTGAGVTLSVPEYDFLKGAGASFYDSFGTSLPSSKPSTLLEEGKLALGGDGWRAEVLITPGHSPGSVCLYMPDSKVLVSGDVVFPGSIGRMDFVGGSTRQMKESIDRLSRLDIEYILSGHSSMSGPLVSGKDNVVRNFQMVRMFF